VLQRKLQAEPFDETDISKLQSLMPYITEAIEYAMSFALSRGRIKSDLTFSAMIDDNLHLHHIDGQIAKVLENCDNLYFANGCLLPEADSLKTVFQNAIRSAAKGRSTQFRFSVVAGCNSLSGSVLKIEINPSPKAVEWLPDSDRRALLSITRIEKQQTADFNMFSDVFGLTSAETTALKALAEYQGTREAATTAGISYKTLRWHLRNIFSKTGYRSQEGLLRALLDMNISNSAV